MYKDRVNYWLDIAAEDVTVADVLFHGGKFLYAGFMCHLVVEKALKAKIQSNGETPPKIHNLVRLAEMGGLFGIMTEEQAVFLDTLNPLQIEARYPAYKSKLAELLTSEKCADMIAQSKEMLEWIKQQL